MTKYVLDTSALIDLKNFYSPSRFEGLWEIFTQLNKEGKLLIIDKVKDEILSGDDTDFLKNTFILDKAITKTDSDKNIAATLMNTHFRKVCLIAGQKPGASGIDRWAKSADPFVIAYADLLQSSGEQILVITSEKQKEGSFINMRFLCKQLKINFKGFTSIFELENIRFVAEKAK